jgi:hypothetical protein
MLEEIYCWGKDIQSNEGDTKSTAIPMIGLIASKTQIIIDVCFSEIEILFLPRYPKNSK